MSSVILSKMKTVKKKKKSANRHFKVKDWGTKRTTDELKGIFFKDSILLTEHNINCLCLLVIKRGEKFIGKKKGNQPTEKLCYLIASTLLQRYTHTVILKDQTDSEQS